MLMTDPFVSVICREQECKFTRESDSPKKIIEIIKEHTANVKHMEYTYIYTMEVSVQENDGFVKAKDN